MTLATRLTVALLAVALRPVTGLAQSQTTTLEAQPATIEVPAWKHEVEARLVLRNTATDAVVDPKLTAFTNDGFSVKIEPPGSPARLEGPASQVWTVRITELDKARVPGIVQFEATFGTAAKPGLQQHLYASVKLQAPPTADKAIEVTVQGAFEGITENRPGVGYVLVTNNQDVAVDIKSIKITQTSIGQAQKKSLVVPVVAPFNVPERSSAKAQITLEAADQVTPGKQTLVFDVLAAWTQGGHGYERHLIVTKDATVGVFFESEILKALGIPSFLLLPGCLFIFTMQLLLTLGLYGVNRHSKPPELPVTSPGFWILAITYSGLFAAIYTWTTGTDYLTQYGSRDLRNVWLWSIVLGFLVYSFIALVTARSRRLRVPSTGDGQIETLLKMGRRGIAIHANPVKFKIKEVEQTAFLIESIEDGQPKVWVAPQISTTWSDDTALAKFVDLVNARATATVIGEALKDGWTRRVVTIAWARTGSVPNPYHLDVQSISEYQAPDLIVTTG
jgi:hypothetical protein